MGSKALVLGVALIGLAVTIDGVVHDFEAHAVAARANAMMQHAQLTYSDIQKQAAEAKEHYNKCFGAGDAKAVEDCMKGKSDAK